jgi:predicted dehydrogenase
MSVRLGLIGAGRWGRNYIRTIAGLDGIDLAHVASANPATPSLLPPGCELSTDWRAVVDDSRLHGVIVAAPAAAHEPIVLAAIDGGRPVLVEKPLALTVAGAERVLAAARARSILVMVGHTHLFHPAFRELKRIVRAQDQVRAVLSQAGNHGPYRTDVSVLWDWGPHDIAMCIDLLGSEPDEVAARRLEARPVGAATAERLELDLKFGPTISARLELSTLDERRRRFAVWLGDRELVYDDLAPSKLVWSAVLSGKQRSAQSATPVPIAKELPLTRALLEFTHAVAVGELDLASLELGVSVVRTLTRCDAVLRQA